MISLSWFTVNYFHVSFGKQDKLQEAIKGIKSWEALDIDLSQKLILEKLLGTNNKRSADAINHFDNNVPHYFLSPWLGSESRTSIYSKSRKKSSIAPYALFKDRIIIQQDWLDYFKRNTGILKAFCYWH